MRISPIATAALVYVFCGIGATTATPDTSDGNNNANNFAIIVSASRYWFNYRHTMNALSFYNYLKEYGGYTDDRIILMLADDFSNNPRNVFPNKLYADMNSQKSLYNASSIEIDYLGNDVNAEQFLNVLYGKSSNKNFPVISEKTTNNETRLLLYMTGHGGDQFLKFHDIEELMGTDMARAIDYMHENGRYEELLFIADTCQAFTLGDKITAPNVYVIGSSLRDESSYAHHSNADVGLAVIERYTHSVIKYLERAKDLTQQSLEQALVQPYSYKQQRAHIGARAINAKRSLSEVKVSEFFTNKIGVPKIAEWEGCSSCNRSSIFVNSTRWRSMKHEDTDENDRGSSDTITLEQVGSQDQPRTVFIKSRDSADEVFLACVFGLAGVLFFAHQRL